MTTNKVGEARCVRCGHARRFFYQRIEIDDEPRCWHEDADGFCGCKCDEAVELPERIWVDLREDIGGASAQWMDAKDWKPEDDDEDRSDWAVYVCADTRSPQSVEKLARTVVHGCLADIWEKADRQNDVATIEKTNALSTRLITAITEAFQQVGTPVVGVAPPSLVRCLICRHRGSPTWEMATRTCPTCGCHCVFEQHPYRAHADRELSERIAQRLAKEDAVTIEEMSNVISRELAGFSGSAWRDISSAPKGRKLILGYFNPLGKWRTVLGCYHLEGTLESDTDDSGFAPEGWYESTEAYEYLMPLEHEPTKWQPLPAPPVDEEGGK